MIMLRITGCRDPLLWYAGLVGACVPYCGRYARENSWKSLEPGGYVNIVRLDDAELVELQPGVAEPVRLSNEEQARARGDLDA